MIEVTRAFPAHPAAVRDVRRFVHQTLDAAGVEPTIVDDAVLMTSEIITNAVLHASTPAELRLSVGDQRIRISVTDASSAVPEIRVFDFVSASGRGLAIVAAMAADWGVDSLGAGKRVWFEVMR